MTTPSKASQRMIPADDPRFRTYEGEPAEPLDLADHVLVIGAPGSATMGHRVGDGVTVVPLIPATGPEVTAAVRRAAQKYADLTGSGIASALRTTPFVLAAGLDVDCHESVPYEWADGDEGPCNAPAVGYRLGEGSTYPVCEDHVRAPMVPLTVAILGADQ